MCLFIHGIRMVDLPILLRPGINLVQLIPEKDNSVNVQMRKCADAEMCKS